MTKAKLHPTILEFRGAMGDMVFKKRYGKIYAYIKPTTSDGPPSEAQLAQRQRFTAAVEYGNIVMADDEARQLYELAGKDRDMSAFAVMVADALNTPEVKEIDLSTYSGAVGNIIRIKAIDDFSVSNVQVTIRNGEGAVLETNDAIETGPGSGLWQYTATTPVSAGTTVTISATAKDLPGGVGELTQSKTL